MSHLVYHHKFVLVVALGLMSYPFLLLSSLDCQKRIIILLSYLVLHQPFSLLILIIWTNVILSKLFVTTETDKRVLPSIMFVY